MKKMTPILSIAAIMAAVSLSGCCGALQASAVQHEKSAKTIGGTLAQAYLRLSCEGLSGTSKDTCNLAREDVKKQSDKLLGREDGTESKQEQ